MPVTTANINFYQSTNTNSTGGAIDTSTVTPTGLGAYFPDIDGETNNANTDSYVNRVFYIRNDLATDADADVTASRTAYNISIYFKTNVTDGSNSDPDHNVEWAVAVGAVGTVAPQLGSETDEDAFADESITLETLSDRDTNPEGFHHGDSVSLGPTQFIPIYIRRKKVGSQGAAARNLNITTWIEFDQA